MGPRARAAVVVFLGWFALLTVTSFVNGRPFFPPKMEPSTFIILQLVIAALLGACAWVVASLIILLGGMQK